VILLTVKKEPKPTPPPKPSAPKPAPAPAEKENKFRQDSNESKPSDKLRDKPLTSGQSDPKLKREKEKKKPLSKEEAEALRKKKAAAKENRQLDKSKHRAEKSGERLDKAKDKLASKKPIAKPGAGKIITSAAAVEVKAQIHGKLSQVEKENSGTEAANKSGLYAGRGVNSSVRLIKDRIRTRPARRVKKLEKKNIRARADNRFREMAKTNPELKKNALKKHLHKKRIQKQFQKQAKKNAAKTAKQSAVIVKRIAVKVFKPVLMALKNPKVLLIIGLALLLLFIISACAGMVMSMLGGLGGAVQGGTSYVASDADIDEAELRYTEWEVDLLLQARNAETSHNGYDEYRYNIDAPGHDPYALLAYLTAKHDNFTFSAIQAELQSIFNQQYSLTFTPSVEIRTRMEERTDTWTDDDGVEHSDTYEVEVEYEWHIMTVTLTARSLETILAPLLTTTEQQERYAVLLLTRGGRQYVGNPMGLNNWTHSVSTGYGYFINAAGAKEMHPGVTLALPVNTPVLAGGKGTVLEVGNNAAYGNYILIDYGDGITARYGHFTSIYHAAGQPMQAGWILGISSNKAYIEIMSSGRHINPAFFMDGTLY